MTSALQVLHAAKNFARAPYAWPGGYPQFLLMADGESLCAPCTRAEFKQIAGTVIRRDNAKDWTPAAVGINWEDSTLTCAHCGKRIESAYGETDTSEGVDSNG